MNNKRNISFSFLPLIEVDPELFRKKLYREDILETSRSFEFGKTLHAYIMTPDRYHIDYINKPEGKMAKFIEIWTLTGDVNKAYEEAQLKHSIEKVIEQITNKEDYVSYRKWLEENKDKNSVALSNDDYSLLLSCKSALENDDTAYNLLFVEEEGSDYYNEIKLNFSYSNEDCSAIIDRLVIDRKNKTIKIIDLKTTKDIKTYSLLETTAKYHYDAQLALYMIAVSNNQELFNITKEYKFEAYIVWVSKKGSNQIRNMFVGIESIKQAAEKIKLWFSLYHWHFDNNLWRMPKEFYDMKNMIVLS